MKFLYTIKNLILKFLRSILGLFGLELFVSKARSHYVPDYFGKSAHKQKDIRTLPVFGELSTIVIQSGRSSLYYDRLITIYQILDYLKSSPYSKNTLQIAEVGVYKGGTSYFVASLADEFKLQYRHYCFDTFQGHAKEDINTAIEKSHYPGAFNDTSFESVQEYLKSFESLNIYKGRFQETSHILKNLQMHFVHLDMDIYEPTIYALKFFANSLVKGGVILLDDYGFETCPGIEKAVEEFKATNTNYFGFTLLSGQYMLVKISE